ncbi:hypothetical protein F0P96_14885 [Hymenobacter busanensis]|uniref:Uncharacterized protein n=1 Tax=Hymenobacter busanensis TaxID=2607656 RepID=A0A7L5A111_9BACT|nr:hypothetical protein [Hymenobacter busanensis]KAA9331521.1 hypothetical protein F0P96_14885 [Hymenobacter busanensis]QHJ08675.1 hypothetical protein GUY19_15820 [Hymenobacter busanensis]
MLLHHRLANPPAFSALALHPDPATGAVRLRYALPRAAHTAPLAVGAAEAAVSLTGLRAGQYSCTLVVDGRPVAVRRLAVVE